MPLRLRKQHEDKPPIVLKRTKRRYKYSLNGASKSNFITINFLSFFSWRSLKTTPNEVVSHQFHALPP